MYATEVVPKNRKKIDVDLFINFDKKILDAEFINDTLNSCGRKNN